MTPEANTLGITPVAPHSLNVRPITICDNSEITLSVLSRNHNFLISIDGRSETCSEDAILRIYRAPYSIRVVKRPDSSFFRTLREKLMWGNDIRIDKSPPTIEKHTKHHTLVLAHSATSSPPSHTERINRNTECGFGFCLHLGNKILH